MRTSRWVGAVLVALALSLVAGPAHAGSPHFVGGIVATG